MQALGQLLFGANCCDEYSPRLAASWQHVPPAPYFF